MKYSTPRRVEKGLQKQSLLPTTVSAKTGIFQAVQEWQQTRSGPVAVRLANKRRRKQGAPIRAK